MLPVKLLFPIYSLALLLTSCEVVPTESANAVYVDNLRRGDWFVKPGSVHDGDTFRAINETTEEEIRVRLACIDAPELKQEGGKESRDYLRGMLKNNKEVILAIAEEDRFGRKVAEVFVPTSKGEIAVNGEMVKAGMAHFYKRYNSACPDNAERYESLEKLAIANRSGVWASDNVQKPWDWRRR